MEVEIEIEGSGGCSSSSKNSGSDAKSSNASSTVVAMRYAPKTMVTPSDSDGNGGSTSQDRQDDMQQGNELMEICLFPCLSVIQTETRYVQPVQCRIILSTIVSVIHSLSRSGGYD